MKTAQTQAAEYAKYYNIDRQSFIAGYEFFENSKKVGSDLMEEFSKRYFKIEKSEGKRFAQSFEKGFGEARAIKNKEEI